MVKTIAIQPDHFVFPEGPQSFSERWVSLLTEMPGFEPRVIDIHRQDAVAALQDCSAFMWRPIGVSEVESARRIIPALEAELDIPLFPSARVALFTRDKIAQYHHLKTAGLPIPKTHAFFDLDNALDFLDAASYPLVVKLPGGRGSVGVGLLNDKREATACTRQLFGNGVHGLWQAMGNPRRFWLRRLHEAIELARGKNICKGREGGKVLFQEFLPGNEFDTRITVIGQYATGFRRMNRQNDFRASGSGLLDWNPGAIDLRAVSIAFEAAARLGTPFIAIDFLESHGKPMICELNFAYVAWVVAACPGYWHLPTGLDPENAVWHEAPVDPEALTLREFLRISGLR